MLEVALSHRFAGFALDVDFTAPPGITALFGRSGSGKTSIINAVAGLLRPDAGRITADGRVLFDSAQGAFLPPHRRRLGYIFQEARLFPHLTVRRNLAYGAWFAPRHALREPRDRVIEMLGIGHLLDRRPAALSGGERQRVAIGRAVLSAPRLILADEPLASLDAARKAEILPYFERLRDELSVPMLYVSHSAAEVARLATTVIAIEAGRVSAQGQAADLFSDPAILPLGAREAGAILTARVARHHADGLTELDAGGHPLFLPRIAAAPGRAMRIRVAAHEVILSRHRPEGLSALNILPGRVLTVAEGQGPGAMVTLETPAGRLLARLTKRSAALLELRAGVAAHAIIKTVSVAPGDIGAGGDTSEAARADQMPR
ncbi:molybdate transport system ATP-binding protein [Paracoccus isoporae]|uniref:Molybdate transport system ATP-binding protein n=1 Tax=Paracoccus isoporae TaxID=591205 RepID=A0A1G6WIQ1_9RHOB|nr:molybdenum ABC transporter ATP-binding protein [Paracoccus isoporae]SDD64955.1 molybdate transport system ATP-binding protein [Paracoccus isoporae]